MAVYRSYTTQELENLRKIQLEIMCEIDAICQKNNIEYVLDSGTALGAARHKGFIPWDDDMDISMMRENYDRFIAVCKDALPENLLLYNYESCDNQAGLFAKICMKGTKFYTAETVQARFDQGIFVDIFPIDALSSNAQVATKQLRKCKFWQSVSYLYASSHIVVPHKGFIGSVEKFIAKLAHAFLKLFFTRRQIVANFNKWAKMANHQNITPDTRVAAMSYSQFVFEKSCWDNCDSAPFEGFKFPIPSNMNSYLEVLYGESWREFPPEDKRRNHAPMLLQFPE